MDEQEVKIVIDQQGFLLAKFPDGIKVPIFIQGNKLKVRKNAYSIYANTTAATNTIAEARTTAW